QNPWPVMQEAAKLLLSAEQQNARLDHVTALEQGQFELRFLQNNGAPLVKILDPKQLAQLVSSETYRQQGLGARLRGSLASSARVGQQALNLKGLLDNSALGPQFLFDSAGHGDIGPLLGQMSGLWEYQHLINKFLIGEAQASDLLRYKAVSSRLDHALGGTDLVLGLYENGKIFERLMTMHQSQSEWTVDIMQLSANTLAMGLSVASMICPPLLPAAIIAQALCYLPQKFGEHLQLGDKAVTSIGALQQRWDAYSHPLIRREDSSAPGNATVLRGSNLYPLKHCRITDDQISYTRNRVDVYEGGSQDAWAALPSVIHWAAGSYATPPPPPFRDVGHRMSGEPLRPNQARPLVYYTGDVAQSTTLSIDANHPLIVDLSLVPPLEMQWKKSAAVGFTHRNDAQLQSWERSRYAALFPVRAGDAQLLEEFTFFGQPDQLRLEFARSSATSVVFKAPQEQQQRQCLSVELSNQASNKAHYVFAGLNAQAKEWLLDSRHGAGFLLALTPNTKVLGDGRETLEFVRDPRNPKKICVRLENVTPTRSQNEEAFSNAYTQLPNEVREKMARVTVNGIGFADFIHGRFPQHSVQPGAGKWAALYDQVKQHNNANPRSWGLDIVTPVSGKTVEESIGWSFMESMAGQGGASNLRAHNEPVVEEFFEGYIEKALALLGIMAKSFLSSQRLRVDYPIQAKEGSVDFDADTVHDGVKYPLAWLAREQTWLIGRPQAWGERGHVESARVAPPPGYSWYAHADAPPLQGTVVSKLNGTQSELFLQTQQGELRALSQQQFADFQSVRALALDYDALLNQVIPALRTQVGQDIGKHQSQLAPAGAFASGSTPSLEGAVNFQQAVRAAKAYYPSYALLRAYDLQGSNQTLRASELDRAQQRIEQAQAVLSAFVMSGQRSLERTVAATATRVTLQIEIQEQQFYPVVTSVVFPLSSRPSDEQLNALAAEHRYLRLADRVLVRWGERLGFFDRKQDQLSLVPDQFSRALVPLGRDRQYEFFSHAGQADSLLRWEVSSPLISRNDTALSLDPRTVLPLQTLLPAGFIRELGLQDGRWAFHHERGALWQSAYSVLSLVTDGYWQLRSLTGELLDFYAVSAEQGRAVTVAERRQLHAYLSLQVLQAVEQQVAALQERAGPSRAQQHIGAAYYEAIDLPPWYHAQLPTALKSSLYDAPRTPSLLEVLAAYGISSSDYLSYGFLRVEGLMPMIADYTHLSKHPTL
ncbi:hypothetical protein QN363_19550, partial [Undibacterium sp. CCC2.1]